MSMALVGNPQKAASVCRPPDASTYEAGECPQVAEEEQC